MARELTDPKIFELGAEHVTDEGFLCIDFEPGAIDNVVLERIQHAGGGTEVSVRIGGLPLEQTLVYHSPGGFEWGYGGSGPADLALNILARWLPAPVAWSLHQDFKWAFLAPMPSEGGIVSRTAITRWLWSRRELGVRDEGASF